MLLDLPLDWLRRLRRFFQHYNEIIWTYTIVPRNRWNMDASNLEIGDTTVLDVRCVLWSSQTSHPTNFLSKNLFISAGISRSNAFQPQVRKLTPYAFLQAKMYGARGYHINQVLVGSKAKSSQLPRTNRHQTTLDTTGLKRCLFLRHNQQINTSIGFLYLIIMIAIVHTNWCVCASKKTSFCCIFLLIQATACSRLI